MRPILHPRAACVVGHRAKDELTTASGRRQARATAWLASTPSQCGQFRPSFSPGPRPNGSMMSAVRYTTDRTRRGGRQADGARFDDCFRRTESVGSRSERLLRNSFQLLPACRIFVNPEVARISPGHRARAAMHRQRRAWAGAGRCSRAVHCNHVTAPDQHDSYSGASSSSPSAEVDSSRGIAATRDFVLVSVHTGFKSD